RGMKGDDIADRLLLFAVDVLNLAKKIPGHGAGHGAWTRCHTNISCCNYCYFLLYYFLLGPTILFSTTRLAI
ncbi:MAG: hypothetical protein JW841_06610, partial [Deltaproteobacteria bacterium]|nr:hypothetical protein [Deltaproteobacteria bacterium]